MKELDCSGLFPESEFRRVAFSPVIKVVSGGCNLRCLYCFYSGHQPDIKSMSLDTVGVVMKRFLDFSPKVTFYWHGGEPLLAGKSFYKEVLEIQGEIVKPGQVINNCIQTNATLIDEEWADLFRKGNFRVGLSIDGPQNIHDQIRVNAAGRGSFNEVQRGIKILREKNINFGAIVVMNSLSLGKEEDIFDFMYRNKIQFSVNPCSARPSDPGELKRLEISPMEYANSLLKFFDLWVQTDDPNFRIRPLDDIVKGLMGGYPSFCKFRGECYKFITIDYNGDVYPCDEFLNGSFILGNIVSQSLDTLLSGSAFVNYYSGRARALSDCLSNGCEWLDICKSGCMREWSGLKEITSIQEMPFCQAHKYLFYNISSRLESLGYKIIGERR